MSESEQQKLDIMALIARAPWREAVTIPASAMTEAAAATEAG